MFGKWSRVVSGAGAAVLLVAGPIAAGPPAAEPQDPPPGWLDRELKSLAGGSASLSDWRGDVLVVNFWASWCKPCLQELPILDEWNTAWREEGAHVVAISVDREEKRVIRFVDETALAMPVFHDGPNGLAKILDLPSLPCTYVLDREGRVVMQIRGSSASDLARVRVEVESRLAAGRVRP